MPLIWFDDILEEWRSVPGFEGLYDVSNLGRVRSLERVTAAEAGGHIRRAYARHHAARELKASLRSGYPCVSLRRGGRYWHRSVHVLVAAAFLGPKPEGQEVRHLDGNRANPALSNLCYGTPIQNAEDKRRHGTHLEGEDLSWAKLTEDDVRHIRKLRGRLTQDVLAFMYGVQQNTISRIQTGARWGHVDA